MKTSIPCALVLAVVTSVSADEPGDWSLMSRHGECLPISTISRKLPEIRDLRNPDSIAQELAQRGIRGSVTLVSLNGLVAYQLQVPDRSIDAILIEAHKCSAVAQSAGRR